MYQREEKRKATDLDKPIARKMPRINDYCHCTHCEAMTQFLVKKKSIRKDGLYQFILWRENLRVQRANNMQSLFQ